MNRYAKITDRIVEDEYKELSAECDKKLKILIEKVNSHKKNFDKNSDCRNQNAITDLVRIKQEVDSLLEFMNIF